MAYNKEELPKYIETAGKITVVTALCGFLVFVAAFMLDLGSKEIKRVAAQTATTTLTVLNTPPSFTINAYELTESSTSSPTNSDDEIQWRAIGSDSNNAPYFLLVCSGNASPTANAAATVNDLGTAPPSCDPGTTQWGVSAAASSGDPAIVSTTTVEGGLFAETNTWFAWVCDDDPFNPRCVVSPVQGFSATNSSPFHMNTRPSLTDFANDGPVDPGGALTFTSSSTDADVVGGADNLFIVVCNSNTTYSTTTNNCSDEIASSTLGVTADASVLYNLAAVVRDDVYPAYGYIIDEHGHEAAANPLQADFTVNNVAPTVLGGDIDLNGGTDITLTVPGAETTGFTLDFTVRDANSCQNATLGSEIAGYEVSIYRSSYGTTTCDTTAAAYDPNYCYGSGIATTTWNLSCTASSTQCTGPAVDQLDYTCTFPLWFVADPTDAGPETPAAFAADTWLAAVAGGDDNFATSSLVATTIPVELNSFTALALDLATDEIPYGGLEPGQNTGTLSASTTVLSVGNTGLDQEVTGEAMCSTYEPGNECVNSATSTIPDAQQQFATSELAYGAGTSLSSTTAGQVEIDVAKTTSTSTPNTGVTYWGIEVPVSITLAGNYTGLNTFIGVTAEAGDW